MLLFAILLLHPAAKAQDDESDSRPSSSKKDFLNRFFLSVTSSPYTDLIISPISFHTTSTGNTDAQGNPTYASIPFQSMQYNIFSLGMEARYNLKELDENTAITLAVPASFGIGTALPVDDIKTRGVSGFGSFQVPVMVKLFTGNGSTYKTQKDFGFNIGGGLEFNKIGLINLGGEANTFNKPFILPCVTTGIVFMRGDSPMEINFKYGFGRLKNQDVNGQGDPLLDNAGIPYRRTARGQSIKLTFIYLMNY